MQPFNKHQRLERHHIDESNAFERILAEERAVQISAGRISVLMFGFSLLYMSGCTEDPCVALCEETAEQLRICLQDWPASWNDVGAQSRQDFSDTCSNLWAAERSTLEPRALDDAYEQCEEATEYLSENSQQCDQLRALYLLPASY